VQPKPSYLRSVLVLSLLVGAWLYGHFSGGYNVLAHVADVLHEAENIHVEGNLYRGVRADASTAGYASVGRGSGYGGPVEVLVGVTSDGVITGLKVLENRESPGFFRLLEGQQYFGQFLGRHVDDPIRLGTDIDAISGATMSCAGVATGVREALRTVSEEGLGRKMPREKRVVKFGMPEVSLISLFLVALASERIRDPRWRKRMRWGTLLSGMVVIGFVYTAPITIAHVITLLNGRWPDPFVNLYWYLLVAGVLVLTLTRGRSPYCFHFCPFGAYQEMLGMLTGAKPYRPKQLHRFAVGVQRALAVAAIAIGLALRHPGAASYEPFATIFDLRGSTFQWLLLALVTAASFIVLRPFCAYVCPVHAVVDTLKTIRQRVIEGRNRGRQDR